MNEKDLRVQKSKIAIRDAFLRLLAIKPVDKITISELSEMAKINRKTFYAHYESIEDIISEMEDELLENMDNYIKTFVSSDYKITPFLLLILLNNIYASNPSFCNALISMRNNTFLLEKVKELMKKFILEGMNIPKEETAKTELQIEFYVSGLLSIYVCWLRKGKPCPFEELEDLIQLYP